jgi:predicted permease
MIAAWKYAFPGPLRMTARTMSASRERRQARSLLVVVQTAMAFVLLISAGLMIRTFQALRKIEPGFTHAEQLQILRISIPESLIPEPERVARTQYDIVQKLAAIPGVASAAFTGAMPMERLDDDRVDLNLPTLVDVRVETKPFVSGDVPLSRIYKYISPGLFKTAGTRIVAGRDFSWEEFHGRRPVVIVSENLARELWGGAASALGKRIAPGPPTAPWREVVGVVEDVRNNGVQEPAPTIAYWPSYSESLFRPGAIRALRSVTFVVQSSRAGTEGLLTQIRQAVGSVNGNLPAASIRTMQEVYGQSLARISFTLAMLAIAGAMALLLGIAGIYGVISYVVSQRTREIGIRVALGAESGEIKRMFVRHGLLLAGAGIVCGLGAAAALTRVMKSLLFGVGTLDPVTYAAVPFILAAAAALASYLPARRAAAVDPAETLRAE